MAFLLRLAMLLTIFNLASAIPCPAPPSPPPSSCGPPSSPPAPRVPPPAPKSLSQPASRPVSPGKANGLKSFAAIGDSYAAGLGSGIFVDTAPDVSETTCLRQSNSYSLQLLGLKPFGAPAADFEFTACSGAIIADVDGQVAQLAGKKFDLVTVTIGGNDFGFSDIAAACVYPTLQAGVTNYQDICDASFNAGMAQLSNQTKLASLAQKLSLIKSTTLAPGGKVFVTGYPKFFATPVAGDACDSISFFPIAQLAALNMTAANRLRANNLVVQVNANIQSAIASTGPEFSFVDWDRLYEGKRFCEPTNALDPIGANNPDVWFNDLATVLPLPGVAAMGMQTPGLMVDIEVRLQQASAFHPKVGGQTAMANELKAEIMKMPPLA